MQLIISWSATNPDGTPLTCDYFYESVPILVRGEGTDGSTSIVNSGTGKFGFSLGSLGSAQVDTDKYKFGAASIKFLGTGTTTQGSVIYTSDLGISANPAYMLWEDFTHDFWVYPNSLPSSYAYLLDGRVGMEGAHPALRINSSGYLEYYVSSAVRITSSVQISTGAWSYIELSRTRGTTRLFLNGVEVGSWADTTSYVSTRFCWGASSLSNITTQRHYGLDGWMDEMRILRGHARNITAYTPPTVSAYGSACDTGLNTFIASLSPKVWFKYDEAFTDTSIWSGGSVFANSGSESGVTGLVYGGFAGGTDPLCVGSTKGISCSDSEAYPGYPGTTAAFVSQYSPNANTTYYGNTLTICMNIRTYSNWTSANEVLWHEGAVFVSDNQGMYFVYRVATKILDVNYYASGAWRTETIADLTSMGGLLNIAYYHLTWVFNHSAKTLKVYVNGELKGTLSMAYTVPVTTYKANVGRAAANNTTINGNGAKMAVDNFMIFNSELSATDIGKLYSYSLPSDYYWTPPAP